jgi:hypothetical protein
MVRGAWIINFHTMRCKNWVNGIEVVFHLDENGHPAGKLMPLPEELAEKIPKLQERLAYVCRMWQRATLVFYRAYYRHLFRARYMGEGQGGKVFPHYPRSALPGPAE